MKTKHTNGEWKIVNCEHYGLYISCKTKHGMICQIRKEDPCYNANAKLIASAPKWLEVLIKLNDYFFCEKPLEDGEYEDLINQTNKVINKATK